MPKVRIDGDECCEPQTLYVEGESRWGVEGEMDEATIARVQAAEAEYWACQEILLKLKREWRAMQTEPKPVEPIANPHSMTLIVSREMLINDDLIARAVLAPGHDRNRL